MTVQQPAGGDEPSRRDHQARGDIRRAPAVLRAARRRVHGRAAVPVRRGVRRQRLHRHARRHVRRRRARRRRCACAGSSRSASSSAAVVLRRYRASASSSRDQRMGQGVRPPRRAIRRPTCICQQRHMAMMEKEGFRRVDDRPFNFFRPRVRRLLLRSRAGEGAGDARHRSDGAEPAGRPPGCRGRPREVGGARRFQPACTAVRTTRRIEREQT